MGKNHRHKKDLKADKAKVKLKQSKTKFLPKGQNVTNTAFKIKPIVLPEQLKERSSDDILSRKKLNVKDLLSRIKHYNENIRHSACEELAEMVSIYTEEIAQQHLSQICLAISSLMRDKEKKVRKGAVKCIGAILHYIPSEKLLPFLDFFSTNLRCAMTNIDSNIQEDSLLFLDCFISANRDLISKTSEKLLPDFLSRISKLRSESQPGRTLTLNLGSKISSVAWRIKVLSRLHAVLRIILEKEEEEHMGSSEGEFEANNHSTFPIYKNEFSQLLEENHWNVFVSSEALAYGGDFYINRHIVTLVPLLYETWLEVMPEQKVNKSVSESTVLTEEMGGLLTCITNILHLLWRYIKGLENEDINLETVFMSSEGRKFLSYLLKNFPYCQPGTRAKANKSKGRALKILDYNNDPLCVHENLLICFLYLTLHVNYAQKSAKQEIAQIVPYITKILCHKQSLSEESVQCLLDLLTECFGTNYQNWQRSGMDLRLILESAITFYNCSKVRNQNRLKVFQVLSGIKNNEQLSRATRYQNWLSTLPNILCEASVTDAAIMELLELSKSDCRIFHGALLQKLPEIMGNLDKLKIVILSDSLPDHQEETAKRNLASIFYYVPAFSVADLSVLEDFITSSQSDFKEYFQQILFLRAEMGRH